MKLLIAALVYTALASGANATEIENLREGDMRKLNVHEAPVESSDAAFATPDGGERSLEDWRGKHVVLNFWATWCAPCRAEMPTLDALNAEFGDYAFEVVTVATGRNSVDGIRRFFDEVGVETLPILLDPQQSLARDMGVLGLPVTVILDPEGREIGRLMGDADWHSESARAIVAALIGAD